ncbi:MAG TPA: hypothetical protein VFY35_02950, partial [Burkholderiaceae bacterium]|nr:hypothetical protein [Burkholderiaceae bacterium]
MSPSKKQLAKIQTWANQAFEKGVFLGESKGGIGLGARTRLGVVLLWAAVAVVGRCGPLRDGADRTGAFMC